jgi:Domain of unknown function (DUF4276)
MRLLVHVEGQTEETFVKEVLRDHLLGFGYTSVQARLIGNARLRAKRGGIRSWSSVKGDVVRHLKEDTGALSTLMVDYYAMPATGDRGWPGRAVDVGLNTSSKARILEDALKVDVASAYGPDFDAMRFLPFVLMYEFEGLLFSDCEAFARGIGCAHKASSFFAIRNAFQTPEDINDSPQTAPSKRIEGVISSYEKPLHGILGLMEIGLEVIKRECPNFRGWLERLEALAGGPQNIQT